MRKGTERGMSDNIILFPEFEKLKTEISSLKARISELLCMRDSARKNLNFSTRPYLHTKEAILNL